MKQRMSWTLLELCVDVKDGRVLVVAERKPKKPERLADKHGLVLRLGEPVDTPSTRYAPPLTWGKTRLRKDVFSLPSYEKLDDKGRRQRAGSDPWPVQCSPQEWAPFGFDKLGPAGERGPSN